MSVLKLKLINAIVSDEASNCRKARELLCKEHKKHNWIEFRFMAHIFNLIGYRMSKSDVIQDIGDLITFIGRSNKVNLFMMTRQPGHHETGCVQGQQHHLFYYYYFVQMHTAAGQILILD